MPVQTESPAVAATATRRPATFADLKAKKARETDLVIEIDGVELTLRFRAVSSTRYDELVAENPPTRKQKEQGSIYDPNTFAPQLISECSLEPKLTVPEATEIYTDPNWAGGEITDLFLTCVRLCQAGLDVPFSAAG